MLNERGLSRASDPIEPPARATRSFGDPVALPARAEQAGFLEPPERRDAAVFDSDPATPMPPDRPAATLAAPVASSSWFVSME